MIANEFCEFLIVQQDHYLPPAGDEGWIFERESAVLQYNKIINKLEKVDALREEINQIIIEKQQKTNTN